MSATLLATANKNPHKNPNENPNKNPNQNPNQKSNPARARATRHPLLTAALALAVFLAADGALFRSGWYQTHILSPGNTPGLLFHDVVFENQRQSGPNEVLLVGDSTLDNAFSPKMFDADYPHANIKIIKLTIPATTARTWYYFLKAIDPSHNRYRLIVIPLHSYRIRPNYDDMAPKIDTAIDLTGILKFSDMPSLIASYPTWPEKWAAASVLLFPSHTYASDLQDFLLNPVLRLNFLALFVQCHAQWRYEIESPTNSLAGMVVNDRTGQITFPPGANLNSFARRIMISAMQPVRPADIAVNQARNEAFEFLWLSQIETLYRGSPTEILFIQVPGSPVPWPTDRPAPNAPDIRSLLPPQNNVAFLDPHTFEPLEQPANFLDAVHLNNAGEQKFTAASGPIFIRFAQQTTPLAAKKPMG